MEKTSKGLIPRFLYVLPCFVIVSTVFAIFNSGSDERLPESSSIHQTSRSLLAVNDSLIKCIPSGIYSFPADFFTQEQRLKGGVLVHLLIATYVCAMIGVVCHTYFVPSLEIISERLKLPPDIAGATFMAIGTSAPELFSSILDYENRELFRLYLLVTRSFVAEDDIGIGTIIGSAVFNIVGVTGLVGVVLWNEVLYIDWYPIARDCTAYGFTVLTLIWIISDNIVTWWESLILLLIFFLYILIIYFNNRIEECSRNMVNCIQKKKCASCCCYNKDETAALLSEKFFAPEITESQRPSKRMERDSFSVEFTASKENAVLGNGPIQTVIEEILVSGGEPSGGTFCSPPTGEWWHVLWWVVMYPARILFYITIPDSSKQKLEKFFPLTFTMSVIWIGILSYLAVWMVTIIGYTLKVPDSVSGLTVLAAGTSVPEVISSIIVAKNGFGNMAISNLVGSNTFDISFCLGAPWLLKTLLSKKGSLMVFSSALTYTTATLLVTLGAFVLVFVLSGWKLNRTVGLIFFVIYGIFVILACMYELNVFGEINVKTCDY